MNLLPEDQLNLRQVEAERNFGHRHAVLSQPLQVKPGDRILHRSQVEDAHSNAKQNIARRIGTGFGNTCMKIGIMIAMAAIVGQCLMRSGAAERIVLSIRNLLEKRMPPSLS